MNESAIYRILEIPINDIIFSPTEMRSAVVFEGLDELARSIRQVGLLNPPTVRPLNDKYELIAGFRRIKACEICGMQTVPVRVINSSDSIADLQKAHENLFREEVNPFDEGNYFRILLQKNNWKLTDLAVMLHKSASFVSRRISLTEGDPEISEAVKDGRINLSIAEELNRVQNPKSRLFLLGHCVNSGANSDTVRSWRIQANLDTKMQSTQENVVIDPETGLPPIDEIRMQKLLDDTGPKFDLEEKVFQYRSCFYCQCKIPLDNVFTAHFCPTCSELVSQAIRQDNKPIHGKES